MKSISRTDSIRDFLVARRHAKRIEMGMTPTGRTCSTQGVWPRQPPAASLGSPCPWKVMRSSSRQGLSRSPDAIEIVLESSFQMGRSVVNMATVARHGERSVDIAVPRANYQPTEDSWRIADQRLALRRIEAYLTGDSIRCRRI